MDELSNSSKRGRLKLQFGFNSFNLNIVSSQVGAGKRILNKNRIIQMVFVFTFSNFVESELLQHWRSDNETPNENLDRYDKIKYGYHYVVHMNNQ